MTMANPIPVIALQYEHPETAAAALPGKALRVTTILAWAVCAVAWTLIVSVDVITVVVTGWVIALLGGIVAVRGAIERRTAFTVLGAAHVAICLLFVVLVNWLNWAPRDAHTPFAVMGALHVIATGLASARVLVPHWRQRTRMSGE